MNAAAKKIFGIGGWVIIGGIAGAFAQDVMLQRLPFLKVVAEDDKVRVLRYAPGQVVNRQCILIRRQSWSY